MDESETDAATDDTSPLPVIVPPSEPESAPEGPQSAARPVPGAKPFNVWLPRRRASAQQGSPRRALAGVDPRHSAGPSRISRPASGASGSPQKTAERPPARSVAKLEQLKDLYLTAEAIGEDALVRHFDEMSRRQRELISEYFEQAGLGKSRRSPMLSSGPPHRGVPQDL